MLPDDPNRARGPRNDARILAAAVAVLARDGWPSANTKTVAAEAGVSYRPVLQRYPDRTAMALVAWRAVAAETTAALARFLAATQPGAAQRESTGRGGDDAWVALATPNPAQRAAAELLCAAPYDPALAAAILADAGALLQGANDAARTALALGLLLWGRADAWRSDEAAALARAVTFTASDPGTPPGFRAPAPRRAALHPNDPAGEALARATLAEVGAVGFHAATVLRIVARAGVTEGLLFTRYPTKRACFDDALRRKEALDADGIARLHERLRRHGDAAFARALALREVMRPGRSQDRRLDLERLRLAWRDPEPAVALAAAGARFDPVAAPPSSDPAATAHACAVHGATLLALLVPDAWGWPIGTIRAA